MSRSVCFPAKTGGYSVVYGGPAGFAVKALFLISRAAGAVTLNLRSQEGFSVKRAGLKPAGFKAWKAAVSAAAAGAVYFLLPGELGEPGRRMAFIFAAAALFWALEIVPLYTTSLMVVILEILMLGRPGGVMGMDKSGYTMFLTPFSSPIIMLFFGGLTMAVALSKYGIDKLVARKLLRLFGRSPYWIMAGFMLTSAFLSMWMSNTATTAMMMAMVIPLLRQIDADDPFRIGLVLAVPFAANIGGIATPVGTPPNAIVIGFLAEQGIQLRFISWMLMAVPLAVLLLAGTSLLLYVLYPPKSKSIELRLEKGSGLDRRTVWVGLIALLTISLWLSSGLHEIPSGVTALLAVGLLFTLNLLDKSDLKKIEWDVLVLMWGGLALGKGLAVTGLTEWIVDLPLFDLQGIGLVVVFCILAVVFSTFMSNTATANLLIPIVMVIPGENSPVLAIAVALSCSFAMALPISTPPNAIAFATDTIHVRDMIRAGVLISAVSTAVVLVGFKFVIAKVFVLSAGG